MLEEIRIENLGVITSAHARLAPGLTVITGETGAGKTMVLTGLALLLGGRADPGSVRSGSPSASVEGRVTVAPGSPVLARAREAGAEPDEDGGLILVRTVAAEGRSRAFLGGRSVPQVVLADLADDLVTVHGQADQARLRSPARQREALDAFAGADLLAELTEYRELWNQRMQFVKEIDELSSRRDEVEREAAMLRHGLDEIERVSPQPGEDVELAAEAERLGHAEDLRTAAAQAHGSLVGSDDGAETVAAATLVETARHALEHVGGHDPVLAEIAQRLAEIGFAIGDVSTDLARYLDDLQADPRRLDAVHHRRAELGALTRAYGDDVAEVLAWSAEAGLRLLDLESGDERLAGATEQLGHVDSRLGQLAASIGDRRRDAASLLASAVTEELHGLAMAGAALLVTVDPAAERGPWGADVVEMQLIPHRGAPARPLGRGASGGELSRVMLAIEVTLATAPSSGASRPPTFVFDEVDAGVGGRAAVEVGRRLAALARGSQVVVVTHLAQVAAFGERHLVVTKTRADGADVVTDSDVRAVEGTERVRELARMLSGQDDSEAARTHAAELLQQSSMGR
ncbi:MAG TPA: DNA repair protein RecN [Cellulomonadaceae bacterium]|nr:DNA repair protein RecN [Cellulomonadaceae bacterium]